jgi:hypothetical protein
MPTPELTPGASVHSPYPGREQPTEEELIIGRCKRCGRETEIVDPVNGLCAECKWEIKVGLQHPLQKEHHFWSHDNHESVPAAQSQNDSGTSPDE